MINDFVYQFYKKNVTMLTNFFPVLASIVKSLASGGILMTNYGTVQFHRKTQTVTKCPYWLLVKYSKPFIVVNAYLALRSLQILPPSLAKPHGLLEGKYLRHCWISAYFTTAWWSFSLIDRGTIIYGDKHVQMNKKWWIQDISISHTTDCEYYRE